MSDPKHFPKWDQLETLQLNYDADEFADGWGWPGIRIRATGIPFDKITIEDVEKALHMSKEWSPLKHAKIVVLLNEEGQERELRNRHKDGTLPEKEEPSLFALPEPGIGYYYTTLAAHPGKMFRVRCEEVDAATMAPAFCPSREQFDDTRNEMSRAHSTAIWPRKDPQPIPAKPKLLSRWERFRHWLISVAN